MPEGKMKSREGTVVDADDLMEEMTATAASLSEELGKLEGMSNDDKQLLCRTIGLGALKYFINPIIHFFPKGNYFSVTRLPCS